MSKKYNAIPAGYEDELYGEDGEDEFDSILRTAQNLKITIVPDITTAAGLNGEDFDCTLAKDMDIWFDAFRLMWNSYKKTPAAQQSLKVVLLRDTRPLLLALKFFANCPGCNNLKNKNLALFILETLCELYKQHPGIGSSCDDNTRMTAFNFVKTCGIVPLYKSVVETYELQKIRDILVPKIEQLVARHFYKDAAYWAMLLQVTHLFGLFEIVFPLILQDKVFLAEEYLNIAQALQLQSVQFLDSLLDKQKTVFQHCDDVLAKYKYDDIKHNVLSYRPMSKLVTRLAKKYKIDPHLTPNLNFSKACSYMHYLHRKYQDGGMSCDSWRELIRDAANTKALQLDLVTNIATHGDLDEAVYWARYFKVPPDECPSYLQDKIEESFLLTVAEQAETKPEIAANVCDDIKVNAIPLNDSTKPRNSSVRAQEYLVLELPEQCIILVDSGQKFLDMLAYLEQQTLIAFDSEWKPSVCSDNAVSLLQLATRERVYLLDCLATEQLGEEMWRSLGRKIFNNMEILKMGFSLKQDLQMLYKSLPALQLNLQNCSCYLDLRDLWRRLKYMQVVGFNFGHASHSGESLCALSEVCLGKKLDKSNQCSNWANRPLRRDQIIYAALDAHCLLQIYQVLAELLLRIGLDIDQVVDDVTTAKSGYLLNTKRATPVANIFGQETYKAGTEMNGAKGGASGAVAARSNEFKFICDSMLLGLSKELRKLGIDCIEITNTNIDDYIALAKTECRYLLTRDSRYALFSQELPTSQCIQIPIDSSVEQVINVISFFKIDVNERNLFSRCIQCNYNEFILVNNREMQELLYGQVQDSIEVQDKNANTNPFVKTYKLLNFNDKILRTKRTHRGTPIKLNRVKRHIVRTKECIYICDNCGVCTWDGAQSIHSSILKYIADSAGSSFEFK